MKMTEFLGLIR